MFGLSLGIALFHVSVVKLGTGMPNYGVSDEVIFKNFNVFIGFRLSANISQVFHVSDYKECSFRCVRLRNFCLAFNFGPGQICETSTSDFYRNKTALVEAKGYLHFYIRNPCSSFPCQNNGICQPKYSLSSYVCQCASGYNGLLCEIGPLGMEDGRITDEQMSVSSYYVYGGRNYDGSRARLNLEEWPAAWEGIDANPWIKVDLLVVRKICAVATQGWGIDNVHNSFVTKYKLATSLDDAEWVIYEENGEEKVFDGNEDRVTAAKNTLNDPPLARFVKILPTHWYARCRMRLELYGV